MQPVQAYNGESGVYLLHFEPRYKHAGHYMGYADDIGARVYAHEFGKSGARLPTAAAAAGCSMILTRVWLGAGRNMERKLKGGLRPKHIGSLARLCPLCKERKQCRDK